MKLGRFHSYLNLLNVIAALLLLGNSVRAQSPTCRVNEEFRPDGGPRCENCGPRCLAWSNQAKCYCKQGFSRYRGVCIANKYCPKGPSNQPQCPVNEEFSLEGGPFCENCGPVCQRLSSEPKCYCKPGHFRLNWVCVPSSQCPSSNPGNPRPVYTPRCPINEEFSPEGGALCENCGPQCLALTPEPKCYCKPGFSRLTGICIPNSECPDLETTDPYPCPQGEELKRVGAECEFCKPRCNRIQQVPKCYCLPGSLRDSFGICIPPWMCPA